VGIERQGRQLEGLIERYGVTATRRRRVALFPSELANQRTLLASHLKRHGWA
jgi:hypothetical protein